MPPFVPKKRLRSRSPPPSSSQPTPKTPQVNLAARKKPTLFNAVDKESTAIPTAAQNEAFLQQNDSQEEEDGENSSDISEVDSDEFEDVIPAPSPKRRKAESGTQHPRATPVPKSGHNGHNNEDEEGDEMEWEDATAHPTEPVVSGDLHLTLDEIPEQPAMVFTNPLGQKKGPTKIERQIRTNAHCMHVQSLMYHNFLRNRWLCDKKLHKILIDKVPPWMMKEIQKYKAAVGMQSDDGAGKDAKTSSKQTRKEKAHKDKKNNKTKNERDWGSKATHSDPDAPFLLSGDPTLPFLRNLVSFWRKKFNITAPGLRKQGYKDLARIEQELKSLRKDDHDPEEHGERIRNIEELRDLANHCKGSRDVGAQLFTALLRGIGLECRMTANLQPIGFGWNQVEEASPPKPRKNDKSTSRPPKNGVALVKAATDATAKPVSASKKSQSSSKSHKSQANGTQGQPIQLSDDESELSSVPDSDEDSALDTTVSESHTSSKRYDRDLPYPAYWTEVLSPISHTWIPLDPIVLSVIVSEPEDCVKFEPRGSRAEKAKQVFAYVVAFSADGSAKDVTVRYMKNRMWPGKTKGVRIPIEKVPVYNKRGKIKHYEEYDWFKTVMSCYTKSSIHRTPADDVEDSRELVAVKPNRQSNNAGAETLQGYKQSAEFVLERHLRREEALIPKAKIVKWFKTGKGEDEKEEPVYYRADVVPCKSTESWHKEGRGIKQGEQPLKHVPMRAVTTLRKREIEEAERETGEKMKQGLYARYQTDWIIPPAIENGVIPKNAYGNMDVFAPSMVPRGAIHIPLRGTAKVCRRLGIDHAEACTGFEFGNRMAVPVLTGVVVAKENEDLVIDSWETEEAEKRKKEQAKREKIALGTWKKMLAGLKVLERVRNEYGEGTELKFDSLKLDTKAKRAKSKNAPKQAPVETPQPPEDMEGGFIRDTRDSSSVAVSATTDMKNGTSGGDHSSSDLSDVESDEEMSHSLASTSSAKKEDDKGFGRRNHKASSTPNTKPNLKITKPRKTKLDNGPSPQPAGRRNASRKSKESVRSRYFEADSNRGDESD